MFRSRRGIALDSNWQVALNPRPMGTAMEEVAVGPAAAGLIQIGQGWIEQGWIEQGWTEQRWIEQR
jgi:hypothetical protein